MQSSFERNMEGQYVFNLQYVRHRAHIVCSVCIRDWWKLSGLYLSCCVKLVNPIASDSEDPHYVVRKRSARYLHRLKFFTVALSLES